MKLERIRYRAGQGIRHLINQTDPAVDAALQALVTPAQWVLLERLAPADRVHLLKVHRELIRAGHQDPDLLRAALLHDVGKADESVNVTLTHRVLNVLLNSLAPALKPRMTGKNDGWIRHGMYLTLHHPSLGAELVRLTGASERTCWLIEHHTDGTIRDDAQLAALQAVDAKE
jgi:hypothetical protein